MQHFVLGIPPLVRVYFLICSFLGEREIIVDCKSVVSLHCACLFVEKKMCSKGFLISLSDSKSTVTLYPG